MISLACTRPRSVSVWLRSMQSHNSNKPSHSQTSDLKSPLIEDKYTKSVLGLRNNANVGHTEGLHWRSQDFWLGVLWTFSIDNCLPEHHSPWHSVLIDYNLRNSYLFIYYLSCKSYAWENMHTENKCNLCDCEAKIQANWTLRRSWHFAPFTLCAVRAYTFYP
jgi:hypothetical protein